MRKLILILSLIFIVTLSSPSYAEGLICKFTGWNCPVDIKDLVKRKGLYYKKVSDVPFTGKTTGKVQGSLKNGEFHGPYVDYWDNGKLWSKGTYKDGKEEGPWVTYYKNGQLWGKGTFKDGKKEGPWVWYRKDGTVWERYTGTYKNGVKVK
ncbi:MAG: hypothetical protein VW270_12145 [Candidatus Poseidoniales archaeon]